MGTHVEQLQAPSTASRARGSTLRRQGPRHAPLRRLRQGLAQAVRSVRAQRHAAGAAPGLQAEEVVMLKVGIDPGAQTGFAVWSVPLRKLSSCKTLKIHQAMDEVLQLHRAGQLHSVTFEDARLRTWFGKMDREQAKYGAAVREGAGSIKRDCTTGPSSWASTALPTRRSNQRQETQSGARTSLRSSPGGPAARLSTRVMRRSWCSDHDRLRAGRVSGDLRGKP